MSRHTLVHLTWLRLFAVACFSWHFLARLLSRDPALPGLGVLLRDRPERWCREEDAVALHAALGAARGGS